MLKESLFMDKINENLSSYVLAGYSKCHFRSSLQNKSTIFKYTGIQRGCNDLIPLLQTVLDVSGPFLSVRIHSIHYAGVD